MNEMILQLADEQATEALGARLAGVLVDGFIVYLTGDLGAGKTTLVRGLLRQLGHAGAVKSPTYTLVEEYQMPQRNIIHFDLYRLHDPEELDLIGIRDYVDGPACCFFEWPERGKGWIPQDDLGILLQQDGRGRRATLIAKTPPGEDVLLRLQALPG